MIYSPFIRLLDKQDEEIYRAQYNSFVDFFRSNEDSLANIRITEQDTVYGEFAKALCAELEYGLNEGIILAYQPQYNYDGNCVGVEALLRWKHPDYGMLYPPLIIKLAKEGNFLADIEEAAFMRALNDRPVLLERFGQNIKLSINVTGNTIVTSRYLQFCQKMNSKYDLKSKNICLEVTEQDALYFDENTINAFNSLRELGLFFAIDDFSMGQTSINYLKENLFDFIKLDGSLVRGLFSYSNCEEIILSITHLAENLHINVIAEYVETKEQRDALHRIGCDCYQGYLYSPAIFLPKGNKKIS